MDFRAYLFLLSLILVVAKLLGFIGLAWWLVLLPAYLLPLLFVVVFVGACVVGGFASICLAVIEKLEKRKG